ncbi:hypothetical protein DFH11DRAFT_1739760 [Phellopilus nigrolimitatus]|nr:hypothetical protein DFH11DRAFT_1739760 [Phellopilus nigrolimitatus]
MGILLRYSPAGPPPQTNGNGVSARLGQPGAPLRHSPRGYSSHYDLLAASSSPSDTWEREWRGDRERERVRPRRDSDRMGLPPSASNFSHAHSQSRGPALPMSAHPYEPLSHPPSRRSIIGTPSSVVSAVSGPTPGSPGHALSRQHSVSERSPFVGPAGATGLGQHWKASGPYGEHLAALSAHLNDDSLPTDWPPPMDSPTAAPAAHPRAQAQAQTAAPSRRYDPRFDESPHGARAERQYPPPGAPEAADKRRGRKPKDADSMNMRGPPTPVPKSVVHVPPARSASDKIIPRPAIRALLIDLSGTLHIPSAPTTVAAAAVSRAWQAGLAVRFCSNTSQEIARARCVSSLAAWASTCATASSGRASARSGRLSGNEAAEPPPPLSPPARVSVPQAVDARAHAAPQKKAPTKCGNDDVQSMHPCVLWPKRQPPTDVLRRATRTSSRVFDRGKNSPPRVAHQQAERKSALEATVGVPRTAHGSGKDREHVAIAPITPTILKAGGVDKDEGMLYMTARRTTPTGTDTTMAIMLTEARTPRASVAIMGTATVVRLWRGHGVWHAQPCREFSTHGSDSAVSQRVGNVTASPPLSFGGQAHFVPSPVPEAEVEQNEDVQMEEAHEEQGFKLRPNDVRHRRSKDRGVRLVVLYSNGSTDSVNRRNPPEASALLFAAAHFATIAGRDSDGLCDLGARIRLGLNLLCGLVLVKEREHMRRCSRRHAGLILPCVSASSQQYAQEYAGRRENHMGQSRGYGYFAQESHPLEHPQQQRARTEPPHIVIRDHEPKHFIPTHNSKEFGWMHCREKVIDRIRAYHESLEPVETRDPTWTADPYSRITRVRVIRGKRIVTDPCPNGSRSCRVRVEDFGSRVDPPTGPGQPGDRLVPLLVKTLSYKKRFFVNSVIVTTTGASVLKMPKFKGRKDEDLEAWQVQAALRMDGAGIDTDFKRVTFMAQALGGEAATWIAPRISLYGPGGIVDKVSIVKGVAPATGGTAPPDTTKIDAPGA